MDFRWPFIWLLVGSSMGLVASHWARGGYDRKIVISAAIVGAAFNGWLGYAIAPNVVEQALASIAIAVEGAVVGAAFLRALEWIEW